MNSNPRLITWEYVGMHGIKLTTIGIQRIQWDMQPNIGGIIWRMVLHPMPT